jgi:hypothetical protein
VRADVKKQIGFVIVVTCSTSISSNAWEGKEESMAELVLEFHVARQSSLKRIVQLHAETYLLFTFIGL